LTALLLPLCEPRIHEGKQMTIALLDKYLTPDQIAERINATAGVPLTGRTVWDKAKRIGVAQKIGRSMLISIDDIPLLLKMENKREQIEAKISARQLKSAQKKIREECFPCNSCEHVKHHAVDGIQHAALDIVLVSCCHQTGPS
jgi:hypothetical protein